MSTVVEVNGQLMRSVPFGCSSSCAYCTHGEWMRLLWSRTSHYVVDGRLTCRSPVDMASLRPASEAPRCRSCLAVFARREREAGMARQHVEPRRAPARPARPALKVARRAQGPEPGTVFVGVDPLVEVLQRYERGEL